MQREKAGIARLRLVHPLEPWAYFATSGETLLGGDPDRRRVWLIGGLLKQELRIAVKNMRLSAHESTEVDQCLFRQWRQRRD